MVPVVLEAGRQPVLSLILTAESPVCLSCLVLKGSLLPQCRAQPPEADSCVCSAPASAAFKLLFTRWLVFMDCYSFRETLLGQIAAVPGPSLQAFSGSVLRYKFMSGCQTHHDEGLGPRV